MRTKKRPYRYADGQLVVILCAWAAVVSVILYVCFMRA